MFALQVVSIVNPQADSSSLQPVGSPASGHPGFEHAARFGMAAAESAPFSRLPGTADLGSSPSASSALPLSSSLDWNPGHSAITVQEANLLLDNMKVGPCLLA